MLDKAMALITADEDSTTDNWNWRPISNLIIPLEATIFSFSLVLG